MSQLQIITPYPQLKGDENFNNWKFRLNALLEEKGCKSAIDGTLAATLILVSPKSDSCLRTSTERRYVR